MFFAVQLCKKKFDKNHSSNVLCKAEQDQKEAIGILPSSSLQKFDPRYILKRLL